MYLIKVSFENELTFFKLKVFRKKMFFIKVFISNSAIYSNYLLRNMKSVLNVLKATVFKLFGTHRVVYSIGYTCTEYK